jgi:hypothetical protein
MMHRSGKCRKNLPVSTSFDQWFHVSICVKHFSNQIFRLTYPGCTKYTVNVIHFSF